MSRRWRGQIKFNAESHVTADAIENRGIDRIQQLQAERFIRNDIGVIKKLDALGVAGIATADELVGGLAGKAAGISNTGSSDALDALEVELGPPKAPSSERRDRIRVDGFGHLAGQGEDARLLRERLLAPPIQGPVLNLL